MKQEFVTLYGKVIVERDILFVRNINVPFSKTTFAKIGFHMLFVLAFVQQFFQKPGPMYYVNFIVWGLILAIRVPDLYDALIKTSYANRIPLQKIKTVSSQDGADDLHTIVTLHLKNGKQRKIIFRKLEKQYEPFIQAVTSYSSNLQLA